MSIVAAKDVRPTPRRVRAFELGDAYAKDSFAGVNCLVHSAWDLKETNPRRNWEINVEGSKRLVAAALDDGVDRIIFVSSMSAYFGTKQEYGLAKLAVERTVLEAQQIVVRPGLVYGGASGGMSLTAVATRSTASDSGLSKRETLHGARR